MSSEKSPNPGTQPGTQPGRSSADYERRPESVHSESSAESVPSTRRNSHNQQNEKIAPSRGSEDDLGIDVVAAATIGEPSGKSVHQSISRRASRASSRPSRPLSVIPGSNRRGFLGRFSIVPEVEDAYSYKNSTKWKITATVAIATCGAPMGSSIFYPALNDLSRDLNTSETIINMSVALYMLSMSIFPIWWSALSEQHGRRNIYITSFTLFIIFSIICAVSTSAPMLIVFRLLAGGASASVQVVGAGTIADIWEPAERGRAMGMFYLGPLLGPLVAPIIGGALTGGLGWRSTMWFLAIYGLVVWIMLVFLLPETLARREQEPEPVRLERVSTRESAKLKSKNTWKAVKHYLIDPLKVLALLRHPPVVLTVLIAAIAFGSLFILNIAVQHLFAREPYNFTQLQVGLVYLSSGAGYFSASLFGGRWIDKIMAREAKKRGQYDENGKLVVIPEDRMRENAWLAQVVYPASLIWFGWSLDKGVQFMVPIVAMFIFGVSSMLHFALGTTMLTEFVRKRSSAGVAINNFVRNILSCIGTIVAAPWINAVGVGWVMTTVAAFCLVFGCLGIWGIIKKGPQWRVKMDEALKKM